MSWRFSSSFLPCSSSTSAMRDSACWYWFEIEVSFAERSSRSRMEKNVSAARTAAVATLSPLLTIRDRRRRRFAR